MMGRKNNKAVIAISLMLLSFSCSQNSNVYTLPSGKQIKVESITRMNFPSGDSSLVMQYETNISIENKAALRTEVDEIWDVFRNDVIAAKLGTGAVRAVHYERDGVVKSGKGYGFVFVRQEDGTWRCVDDEIRR